MQRKFPLRLQYIAVSIFAIFSLFLPYGTEVYIPFDSRRPETRAVTVDSDIAIFLTILIILSTIVFLFIRKNQALKVIHFIVFMVSYMFLFFQEIGNLNWLIILPISLFLWHIYLHIRNIGAVNLKFLQD